MRGAHLRLNSQARLEFILGSVADAVTIDTLFGNFRIDTIYHAAAYKHVPIVEQNPLEGHAQQRARHLVSRACGSAGTGRPLHSDLHGQGRAPHVMGATKRMAELVVQALAEAHSGPVFSMVRFGNVLGSSGSVVPLFRSQIENGGPISLTHPEVTRYFMTIKEAVHLVIQEGGMARGGEVFVLDMGEPVKIKDLAAKMIHLSGLSVRDASNPQGDIAIEVVGLRPGEKLYEELLISGEATGTKHPRICQVREDGADGSLLDAELRALENAIRAKSGDFDVRLVLARWVRGYTGAAGGIAAGAAPDGQPLTLH